MRKILTILLIAVHYAESFNHRTGQRKYQQSEIENMTCDCKQKIRETFHGVKEYDYNAKTCFIYAFGSLQLKNTQGYGREYFLYLFEHTDKTDLKSPRAYCQSLNWYTPLKNQKVTKANQILFATIKDCYKSLNDVGLDSTNSSVSLLFNCLPTIGIGKTAKGAFELIFLNMLSETFTNYTPETFENYPLNYYSFTLKQADLKPQTLDPTPYCNNVMAQLPLIDD